MGSVRTKVFLLLLILAAVFLKLDLRLSPTAAKDILLLLDSCLDTRSRWKSSGPSALSAPADAFASFPAASDASAPPFLLSSRTRSSETRLRVVIARVLSRGEPESALAKSLGSLLVLFRLPLKKKPLLEGLCNRAGSEVPLLSLGVLLGSSRPTVLGMDEVSRPRFES